jgi:hypothetical protein
MIKTIKEQLINKNNKNFVWLITYSYNQDLYLPEFLTYYLDIIKIDHIIIVEDFANNSVFNNNSKYKKICEFFGKKVTYSYHIRKHNGHTDNQRPLIKLWIDKLKKIKNGYINWLLYVDMDEFLDLKGKTMHEFLKINEKSYENKIGISFMQQLFGHNGIKEYNVGDLITETHKKSIKMKFGNPKWRSTTLDKYHAEKNLSLGKYPIGYYEVIDYGFKAMFKLHIINKPWVHPSEFSKNHYVANPDIANINHYWIIKESDTECHYDKYKIIMRKCISVDLENESTINTNLFELGDKIRENQFYQKSIEFLKHEVK